jgi:aminodeoxyfutalosine deaminase
MRKLNADFILLPDGNLHQNITLVLDHQGIVVAVQDEVSDEAEHFSGILCPGFINAHCHLELSYMEGAISRHRKLTGFIEELLVLRSNHGNMTPASHSTSFELMEAAASASYKNGTQAIGDICNTSDTFNLKAHSLIRYHSFIELFNLDPLMAGSTFAYGEKLYQLALSKELSASIVPHAPYSVPHELHTLIKAHSDEHRSLWCIHSQETESENEMFYSLTGQLVNFFQKRGFAGFLEKPHGMSSVEFISLYFPSNGNLMLVHNTFTSQGDIDFLKSTGNFNRVSFCLCPKANLYIENTLPNIPMLWKNDCMITIGTDSLASNDTLSVFEEIQAIHRYYPEIPIATLLNWATANGADYFGWHDLGRFKNGARPGVVFIEGANGRTFPDQSTVRRLI